MHEQRAFQNSNKECRHFNEKEMHCCWFFYGRACVFVTMCIFCGLVSFVMIIYCFVIHFVVIVNEI